MAANNTVLGCIADDFTGATDLAGLLARSGVKVSLRIGLPSQPPEHTAAFEVIALKCRSVPVDEAVGQCLQALEWLKQAGAQRFFWKYCSTFDSTSEGNIGPVAEALMESLGISQTIYCPAFPENGRSIFMGNLFVGQQPLAESAMKDHPLTPMRDSNLLRLLGPQVKRPVGLIDRLTVARGAEAVSVALADLDQQGTAHVIIDAVANEDLRTIACASSALQLITGGSALAMPLAELLAADGALSDGTAQVKETETQASGIVLSGSCSQMTRQQVEHYRQLAPGYRLDPLTLAKEGTHDVQRWLDDQSLSSAPLIYATAEPEEVRAAQDKLGVDVASHLIESALAELACSAKDKGFRRFVVAGGETSGAVASALQVERLDVGAEIAPGVPWTFSQSGGVQIALALKSGNFGSVSFFHDALQLLEQP